MARGRLISKSLGSSRKFHALLTTGGKLGEFCQLLYPLIIANTDDFGRMPGDAFTVKNVVLPSSGRQERDFQRALEVIASVGLVTIYVVQGSPYLQVNNFDAHQPNLHKRHQSLYPEVPDVPGTSGILPENPDSPGRSGPNLTQNPEPRTQNPEENPEPRLVERRYTDVLFDQFWDAYPNKKAKDRALRAWHKRRPTEALLLVMLQALAIQRQSEAWTRDAGKWIPHPATWLNDGRWTDAVDVDVGLAVTPVRVGSKRIQGLTQGGEAFLKRHG